MKIKRLISASSVLSISVAAAAIVQDGNLFAAEQINKSPESSKQVEKNCAGRWKEGQCGGWTEGRCGGWMLKGSDSSKFPEADSDGVNLLREYCMQCHALPNPNYYSKSDWPYVVERMVWRMKNRAEQPNSGLRVPTDKEVAIIVDYLKRNAAK